jgi:hypothetical protein
MTPSEIAAEVARRVQDQDVFDLAERMDCSMMLARETLEAEAFAAITGQPIDYQADWRDSRWINIKACADAARNGPDAQDRFSLST